MGALADEKTTAHDASGLEAPVGVGWLILQRLGDLRDGQARLEARVDRLEAKIDAQVGELRRDFEVRLARAGNSQLVVGILGFLGVIATLTTVLIRVR